MTFIYMYRKYDPVAKKFRLQSIAIDGASPEEIAKKVRKLQRQNRRKDGGRSHD